MIDDTELWVQITDKEAETYRGLKIDSIAKICGRSVGMWRKTREVITLTVGPSPDDDGYVVTMVLMNITNSKSRGEPESTQWPFPDLQSAREHLLATGARFKQGGYECRWYPL